MTDELMLIPECHFFAALLFSFVGFSLSSLLFVAVGDP